MKLLIHWIVSAILLMLVSRFVKGFEISGFGAALIAVLVIGLVNATLGLFLKIVTFPLTIITFGIFLLIVNALMIMLASKFVPGFHVTGFVPAFWGSIVLSLLNMIVRWMTTSSPSR